jgi:hypothetical protein
MLRSRDSRQLYRSVLIYVSGFLLIVGLASTNAWDAHVAAQGSEIAPNGTVPGTLPESLRARVTFVHAAPFAAPIAATAIDLCDQADRVVDDMTGIIFQQVEPLIIDSGTFRWKVATSGSSCAGAVLELSELRLAPGSHTLVVITGDGVGYPIDSIVTTLNPGGGIWHLPIIIASQE